MGRFDTRDIPVTEVVAVGAEDVQGGGRSVWLSIRLACLPVTLVKIQLCPGVASLLVRDYLCTIG